MAEVTEEELERAMLQVSQAMGVPDSIFEEVPLQHANAQSFIEHAGVKGMKWGVRRQRQTDRLNRVSSGQASLNDKYKTVKEVGLASIIKNKGLSGAAGAKSKEMASRKARLESGKGTVKDVLQEVGNVRLSDLLAK